eukprot:10155653-Lingulodinium_polyedra.AAC.1
MCIRDSFQCYDGATWLSSALSVLTMGPEPAPPASPAGFSTSRSHNDARSAPALGLSGAPQRTWDPAHLLPQPQGGPAG